MVTMICRSCGRRYNYTVTRHCPECGTEQWSDDDEDDDERLVADGGQVVDRSYSGMDYTTRRTPKRQHDPEHSWRFACPEGHRSLEFRQSGGYYCRSCNERFHGDPRDLRTEGGEAR